MCPCYLEFFCEEELPLLPLFIYPVIYSYQDRLMIDFFYTLGYNEITTF